MRDIQFGHHISQGAKDLIDKVGNKVYYVNSLCNDCFFQFQLIVVKSENRMTLRQVMVHPWVQENKAKFQK